MKESMRKHGLPHRMKNDETLQKSAICHAYKRCIYTKDVLCKDILALKLPPGRQAIAPPRRSLAYMQEYILYRDISLSGIFHFHNTSLLLPNIAQHHSSPRSSIPPPLPFLVLITDEYMYIYCALITSLVKHVVMMPGRHGSLGARVAEQLAYASCCRYHHAPRTSLSPARRPLVTPRSAAMP